MRVNSSFGLYVLSAVAIAAAACRAGGAGPASVVPTGGDSVTVEVINMNFEAVNVWAHYRGAIRDRLGLVEGNTVDTFRIAWSPRPLVMVSEFVAAGGSVSNDLDVNPGDFVTLELLPGAARRVRR